MKGACMATNNYAFVEWAYPIVKSMGLDAELISGNLHVKEGPRRFTLYAHQDEGIVDILPEHDELENQELLDGMKWVCIADCRWEDLFCRIVKCLADHDANSFKVVDNSGKVLQPNDVDPTTISL